MNNLNKNNITRSMTSTFISCLALFASLAWTNVHAGTVFTNPDVSQIELNDVFTIGIEGQGFVESLDGFGLNVEWDPSILSLNTVFVDNTLWEFGTSEGDRSTAGLLTTVGGTTFRGVTGDFNLATLTFQAIGSGVTDILINNAGSPIYAWTSFGSPVNSLDFINGSVEVSSVPLPAGVWLMLSAMSTLLYGTRRKQTVA